MPVLTGIDVLGIQDYVFASNRLRDVLAASHLVKEVTDEDFLRQDCTAAGGSVLLAAGGNAVLEFPSLAAARNWTAVYTRRLYDQAPGLEVAVAHRSYTPGGLAAALGALQIELARKKLHHRPHVPLLGLGVATPCAVTGLPAAGVEDGEPLSRRIQALRKREVQQKLQKRWARFLAPDPPAGAKFVFPLRMDHLGRSRGETSLVGVVHVDGNDLGEAIAGWLERCLDEEYGDRRVREEYQAWSQALTRLGETVLKELVRRVAGCVQPEKEGRYRLQGSPEEVSFPLHQEGDQIHLPIRPVLLGGDDLTFVCDGRIALDLAARAVEEFARGSIPHLGESGDLNPTACAGVALVKSHAPFHRAYQLAADLCTSAKRRRHEAGGDRGWLDWHLGLPRPHESVENLRRRAYRHRDVELTLRPYPLDSQPEERLSWRWLEKELLGPGRGGNHRSFRGGAGWRASRRRLERLAEVVPHGEGAVERQMRTWQALEPGLAFPEPLNGGGYQGGGTPLWDALELLDLHLCLEPCPAARAPGSEGDG